MVAQIATVCFHRGQAEAFDAAERFVLLLAGSRGGKTTVGPPWLLREIQRKGPGDYLVVAPSFPLLNVGPLPALQKLFETELRLGKLMTGRETVFRFNHQTLRRFFGDTKVPTKIHLRHATDPDALEAATFKAVWADECGQKKFRLDSWEAIRRRISTTGGRVLLTTTPYLLGWLKSEVFDRAKAGEPDYRVVQFPSYWNPAFPHSEYLEAKRRLPDWKFKQFYRGEFTRPAGVIYDCFDAATHVVPAFRVRNDWRRFVGLDFGGVNTAAVFVAQDPETQKYYLYREYGPVGGRTAKRHAECLREGELALPGLAVGGSKSEGQWRDEFRQAGYPVQEPPVSEVEVGIQRVYGLFKTQRLYVMDSCKGIIDDLQAYSRATDQDGKVGEAIEDKESWHRLDSLRYIATRLHGAVPITRESMGIPKVPRW